MPLMSWITYAFVFFIGGFLVVAPFVIHTTWLSKRAIVKWDRVGIDIGAEGRTLLVLLGGLIAIAAGYFTYTSNLEDVEQKLRKAADAERVFEEAANAVRELLRERYTLEVFLDLDDIEPTLLYKSPPLFEVRYRPSPRDKPFEIKNDNLDGNNDYKIKLHRSPYGNYLTVPDFQRDAWIEVSATFEEAEWTGELTGMKPRLRLHKLPRR
jgi:hypothetical protein